MLKSKPKTKKIKTNKIYILLGIVAVLALVGLYIKSLMASPQVALIAEPSKQMCQTNIVSMSLHDECATPGTFRRAVYTCSNGSTAEKLAGGTNCISYESVLAEAQRNCGQTCTGPSPVPTCVPNPCPADGRTCKLAALPAGQVYCPVATTTPSPSLTPTASPSPTLTPTPTPKPTPTPPVPSPIYSTKPSTVPAPSTCGTSLNKWQFRESCGTKMYRYINFNCSGTTQGQVFGNPNICKSETEWVAEARTACMNAKCTTPTPTPVISTAPKATPPATPTPANCFKIFGRSVCWPTATRR